MGTGSSATAVAPLPFFASGIDISSCALADTHFLAVGREPVPDPGGLAVARRQQHHIGDLERHRLFDDAGLHLLALLALMLLGDVDALDDDLTLARHRGLDRAFFALVFAGDYAYTVTLVDLHQITSGASEMMRMNFLSRSSRPTGPKIRVPRGVRSSLINTAAFSSKRM